MQPVWKKLENENGFPFYFNESTNQKQWDHPKFQEIKHIIDDCNYVKYSKYRLGLKFRFLQKTLFTEGITLNTITGVFQKHQLGTNESSFCLESYDLEAVLYDIYFAAAKLNNNTEIDVDFAVELMQNFLYNIYDKDRQAKIQVSSTKLVLAILSDCEISELYHFIFSLCADHNNCVTRLRLQSMLMKFVDIVIFFHEDVSFGQHLIPATIENCFSNSPGLVGITESNFIAWLEESPQLLCWIPILYRIKSSEFVIHSSKCITCKSSPLVGLKYSCMKCSKYTQCQRCFFMGRTNHSHKLSHSMREYCTETNPKEFTFRFIKKLFGLMPCRVKFNESDSGIVETKPFSAHKDFLAKSATISDFSHVDTFSSPQAQLQHIIKHLETQNRELHKVLLVGNHNEKEIRKYLEEHKVQVANQIQKLKLFKECFQIGNQLRQKITTESTPMVGKFNKKYSKRFDLDMLSPIGQIPECTESKRIGSREQLFISNNISNNKEIISSETVLYSVNDISTWIKEQPTNSKSDSGVTSAIIPKSPVRELHNDLDDALDKLQQILANNFTLDESLGNIDNNNLKHAVSEVEDMLTSFIDNVESSRASSVQPFKQETDYLGNK